MLRSIIRTRTGERDAGVALVAVIAVTAILLLAVGAGLTGATAGSRQAGAAQSSARALDAAYAGVQDYIAKLNADSTYPQYGAAASTFSSTSTVKLPPTTNKAFGLGAGGTWATVPGSAAGSTFRYEVDNSLYGSNGLLRLRSTGRFGAITKTVVASVRQQGFIDYLYFTDFETQDPLITGTSANCDRYLWANPTRDTSSCPTIQFGPNDVIQGPLRSNDTLTICGSTLNGPVVTSNSGSPIVVTPAGCAAPRFNAAAPAYAPVLSMPQTNTAMKAQTYSDVATTPGCLYTGPTQINLQSNGTMTVVSPWTQFTNVKSDGTSGTNPPGCGAIKDLHSTKGATVPVPANNLVYVQGVPSSTTDVNFTPAAATKQGTVQSVCASEGDPACVSDYANGKCNHGQFQLGRCFILTPGLVPVDNGAVPSAVTMPTTWPSNTTYACTGSDGTALPTSSSGGSAGWIFTDKDGTVRFPLAAESPASNWNSGSSWDTTTPAYGCRDGDAFVSGTLSGKVTIASDNYVYATGDVRYNAPSSDVLALVGNNGVLVWNPMSGGTPLLPARNREIDGAILSPAHTFQVQNYDLGGYRGVLTLDGALAQRYRGPVATTRGGAIASGYAKNYLYDARFSSVTPPYYLKPTSASFRVSSYAATPPAFSSTGGP